MHGCIAKCYQGLSSTRAVLEMGGLFSVLFSKRSSSKVNLLLFWPFCQKGSIILGGEKKKKKAWLRFVKALNPKS